MKIKWVFFDIDNTLFNTKELALRARKNAVKAMIDGGLPAKSKEEAYEKLYRIIKKEGSNYDRHFDKLLKEYNTDNKRVIAAGVIAYHDTKTAYLKPFPDAVQTLLKLKDAGYKLGIITNGIEVKQWEKLIRLGLSHFFEIVVISENVGIEKPFPEIFNHALEEAKCKPEEAVMVGDNENDIVPAKTLGMKTISVTPDVKADSHVKKFGEILDAIEKF